MKLLTVRGVVFDCHCTCLLAVINPYACCSTLADLFVAYAHPLQSVFILSFAVLYDD